MPIVAPPDLFSKFKISKEVNRLSILRNSFAYPFFPQFQSDTSLGATELRYLGRIVVNFGSNDYLGLTRNHDVIEAARQATQRFGTGSSGSRLLNGNLDLHLELEGKIAKFLGKESAMILTTGYQTNLAALSTIASRRDVIVADEWCHASIVDGMTLSEARKIRFRHNDLDDLERVLLECHPSEGRLVVVEGVYSGSGATADLNSICQLCAKHSARLYVDDAHGLGVLGDFGRGTCEHYGVESQVDIVSGTFSKALASCGGFIAGDGELIEFLKHYASSFVFSASMPPSSVVTAIAALEVVQREPKRRERLLNLSRYTRAALSDAGFDVLDGITPAVVVRWERGKDLYERSIQVGQFCNQLLEAGFYINPMMGQAVASPVLRINIMAVHGESEIDALVQAMLEVLAAKNIRAVNI